MTVKELKELIKDIDEDYDILVSDYNGELGYAYDIYVDDRNKTVEVC